MLQPDGPEPCLHLGSSTRGPVPARCASTRTGC